MYDSLFSCFCMILNMIIYDNNILCSSHKIYPAMPPVPCWRKVRRWWCRAQSPAPKLDQTQTAGSFRIAQLCWDWSLVPHLADSQPLAIVTFQISSGRLALSLSISCSYQMYIMDSHSTDLCPTDRDGFVLTGLDPWEVKAGIVSSQTFWILSTVANASGDPTWPRNKTDGRPPLICVFLLSSPLQLSGLRSHVY